MYDHTTGFSSEKCFAMFNFQTKHITFVHLEHFMGKKLSKY